MRAVRLHEFDGVLTVEDLPDAEPADGEVLFELAYAPVAPLDVWITKGYLPFVSLPYTPGLSAVGSVDGRPIAIGMGSGMGMQRDGTWRERAAVPAASIIDLPDGIDLAQAAAVGSSISTASRLVGDVGQVTDQDVLLVLGASGGTGSLAVQLAKATGATVWGQTSRAEKADYVRSLGADGVAVAATGDDIPAALGDVHPTVVFDGLGGRFTAGAVEAAAPGARIIQFGSSAGLELTVPVRTFYGKGLVLRGFGGMGGPPPDPDALRAASEAVYAGVAEGRYSMAVETLPLDQADEARRRIVEHEVRGKLLLTP